ncbi:MAG TPA: TolC family protein [Caulobacteraceae bacterium]|nr:TolC family protein [Caulobacteraceae bacterium]
MKISTFAATVCALAPALAAASLLLAAAGVRAAPLTFDEAVELAVRTAPSLQARRMDVAAAGSAAIAAGRLPDPKLRLGLDNFPVSGPPAGTFGGDSMTMASVGLTQAVPNGARRRAERERARADTAAARSGRAIETLHVRLDTALAWVDLYYAERRLAALGEVAKAIAPLRASAPAGLAAGTLRPAQALTPRQLFAALDDQRDDLVAAVATARAQLVRWTGDPQAEVAGAPPSIQVDAARLRADLDRNPTLLAYGPKQRQADADLDAARAARRPDWSFDLAYQHRGAMWGDMVSLGASVSLPLFARTRQDPIIAARAETAASVRVEREAARRALEAQFDADLADHVMHHDLMLRARSTLVPLARERANLETSSYGAGTASLSDVLQAFLALAQAQVEAIDREADAARDAVRINFTYGADPP